MNRPIQYFSKEQVEYGKSLSPTDRARFLEEFRLLHGSRLPSSPSKLISIKMPEEMLNLFRKKCELQGIPYQTQIKELMRQWLFELKE